MRRIIFIVACIVLLTSHFAFATPVQWSAADGGNGHWYEAVSVESGITWSAANAQAAEMGGYLATVTAAEENDFVYSLASDASLWWHLDGWSFGPWLGGYQEQGSSEPDGGWKWVTSESFSFTNWLPQEPSNAMGKEDRLHLIGYQVPTASFWNDLMGEETESSRHSLPLGFVVEYDAVPEPASILALLTGIAGIGGVIRLKRQCESH